MKGKLLAFGVSLLAMATIGVVQLQSKAVDGSRDCDQYAVIRCGALNRDELRREYETNNTAAANGSTAEQADIKKIFTAMGISRADLDARVEPGVVYRDGTVKVNDKVVATGAKMAARGLGGIQIPGTSAQKVSVSAMNEAQTAMVFYKDGKFAFAVMKPCGNPVSATPKEQPTPTPTPQPSAECTSVTATMLERNKYQVTATANVKNGASIKGYHLTVTSGSTTVFDKTYDTANTTQSVVYASLNPGDYKVKATVKTSEGIKGGPRCETVFTVAQEPTPPVPPTTPAVSITKYVVKDGQKYALVNKDVEFNYLVTIKNIGTTDLEGVTVTDTPDSRITLVSVEPPLNAVIKNNTLVISGLKLLTNESRMFSVKAKVSSENTGRIPNTACVDAPSIPGTPDMCDKADVEVPATPVPGQIEVCVLNEKKVRLVNEADVKANPTLYSTNLDDCKETELPAEMPTTGPAETAASVVGAMSLAGAGAYYIASRRTV